MSQKPIDLSPARLDGGYISLSNHHPTNQTTRDQLLNTLHIARRITNQTMRNTALPLNRTSSSSQQIDIQALQDQVANLTTIVMAMAQRDEFTRANMAIQIVQNPYLEDNHLHR